MKLTAKQKNSPALGMHEFEWKLTPGLLKMPYENCVEHKLEECQYLQGESIHWHPRGGSHYSQVSE